MMHRHIIDAWDLLAVPPQYEDAQWPVDPAARLLDAYSSREETRGGGRVGVGEGGMG